MKLFIDTEFNGFNGHLLSMALVPEDNYPEFYAEIEFSGQLDPWVRDNVVLTQSPTTYSKFQDKLVQYLWDVGPVTIVADWPEDIRYFCEALITGPGESIPILHKITFVLDTNISYESKVPHHALHDARAIKESYEQI